MNAGWIDARCAVATEDAALLLRLLERHLPGPDVTCCGEHERLGVEFPTDEDEVLFRLELLHQGTIDDIRRADDRVYLVAPRLSGSIHASVERGAFEAAVLPLTIVDLELRGEGAFRRLEGALRAERRSFSGQPPALWIV